MIIDTNVVIDMIEANIPAEIHENLLQLASAEKLYVNEIVFAELSARYDSAEEVHDVLDAANIRIKRMNLKDCYRAGVAFRQYRRNGGTRQAILADFLIGGHAASEGWPIVTRDRKGFESYFPEVEITDPYKVKHD